MKIDKVLGMFLLIGVAVASVIAWERYGIESEFKAAQITADYTDFFNMVQDTDYDVVDYFKELKDGGIGSIALQEETIHAMEESPVYHISSKMKGMDLIVEGPHEELQFIKNGLEETLKESREIKFVNREELVISGMPKDYVYTNSNFVDSRGNKEAFGKTWGGLKLEMIGLGFSEQKIKQIEDAGMIPALRPIYSHEYQDAKKAIDRYFDTVSKLSPEYREKSNVIVFSGDEFLGYDESDYMYEKLKENGMYIGLVESNIKGKNLKAKGQNSLVKETHYQAIKVFTTWDYIQRRFDYEIPNHHNGEEIVNTYYRAMIDRNVRLIYLKPYLMPEGRYVTDPQVYKDTVTNLQKRLDRHHIVIGEQISPMKNWAVNPIKKIPVLVAIVAGFLLILQNVMSIRKRTLYLLLALVSTVAVIPFALGKGTGALEPIWALLGTIMVASLSGMYVLARGRLEFDKKQESRMMSGYLLGIRVLLFSVLMSVLGALFEVSILSNSQYMLDMITFKGVKISQLVPILTVGLVYMSYFGVGKIKEMGDHTLKFEDTLRLLNKNIKVWQILLLGILAIVGLIFMARSGNTSDVKPSTFELLMRNFMEHHFIARPRTKSIFLGFPTVILFIALAKQRRLESLYPILAIAIAIGQSNIQNTFSHIRTPLYLSIGRVSGEVVLSILTGGIFVWLFAKGIAFADKKKKSGERYV